MKAIDFRNETFENLRERLAGLREQVWQDWLAFEAEHGVAGATTREVCQARGRDILSFRPRCTELYQIGILTLVAHETTECPTAGRNSEGVYRLRSMDEWAAWLNAEREVATNRQLQLMS